MIKLSDRLNTIAKYIDENDRVVDIGCDHALLDIYLTLNRKDIFCIASDIKQNALEQARKNIDKYKLSNFIDIRCGDGLNTITSNDNINTVIISGMGYQTILKILNENKQKLNEVSKLIIQSNTFPSVIRKKVTNMGYYIFDEQLVKDNNIIYTILIFKHGNSKYTKREFEYGPLLLKRKDILFNEHIDFEIKRNKILQKMIPHKYFIKRIKVWSHIKSLMHEKNS
jgi:tRNA (adenine22-N1)-methyltransferase